MTRYKQLVDAIDDKQVTFYRNLADGSLLEIDMPDGTEILFDSSEKTLSDFSADRTPTHIEIGEVTERRVLKLLMEALETARYSDERIRIGNRSF
jgi:hypothetical protein